MRPGEIYRHNSFYLDRQTGELQAKYFVVLARTRAGDIVSRLLTSRPHGRPESPPCYHGNPYPGFYIGIPGGGLPAKSWIDLRHLDDFDGVTAAGLAKKGVIALVQELPASLLPALLDCVAGAPDTTRLQERAIRDMLSGG